MTLQRFLAAASLALCGLAHAGPNLVSNGSFEQGTAGIGSFGGWQVAAGDAATFVDSSGQTGTHPGQASDGLWSAYFGSSFANGGASIAQALATTAGQAYVLSFDLANDNGGGSAANGFVVNLGNAAVASFAALGVQDYQHLQIGFTATAASTLLAFAGYNDNGYLQLDNVAVTAAVPEPSMLALMLGGLAFAGFAGRKRRRG